ncbi:PIN1, partial [Symbiodinium microadriaticum]
MMISAIASRSVLARAEAVNGKRYPSTDRSSSLEDDFRKGRSLCRKIEQMEAKVEVFDAEVLAERLASPTETLRLTKLRSQGQAAVAAHTQILPTTISRHGASFKCVPMANIHPACKPVSGDFHVLNVVVKEHVTKSFNALLTCNIKVPYMKAVNLEGPPRANRKEAVKDGMELGKKFLAEGEAGARSVCLKLKKTRWTPQQLSAVDEKDLYTNHPLPGFRDNQELLSKEEALVPPGEGWMRHSPTMLVHPQSQVFFFQTGEKAGSYVRRGTSAEWQDIDPPHTPQEYDLLVRAGSASSSRRGAKLDRAVILNDVTKIARLALKLPLSFVDRPASAFALFYGVRNADAAQWCAENFHKKLLPRLAEKIHVFTTEDLQGVLEATLRDLDGELLSGPGSACSPYSGCSALLALLLGNRLVMSGVGDCRVVLLEGEGKAASATPLLEKAAGLEESEEQQRFWKAGGMVSNGLLYHQQPEQLDDVHRILSAPNVFDVLLADSEEIDEKQVKAAYRRWALRVHPDKQTGAECDADRRAFGLAFARLEESREKLEAMIAEDVESCRELRRVLRAEVATRAGAAALLGVDKAAATDSIIEEVAKEAERAAKELKRKISKMEVVAPDFRQAEAICDEAVKTVSRPMAAEALPRSEALLREGAQSSRALGLRDLRFPRPLVLMEPKSVSYMLSTNASVRFALLCGATASLSDESLTRAAAAHSRRPKASVLVFNALSDASTPSSPVANASSASVCISVRRSGKAETSAAKRQKTGSSDTVRVRHILLRHQQVRQADPMLRRDPGRALPDAEELALKTLETLLKTPNQFPKLCRELSDCQSGDQPGQLCGDLGWLVKGQTEAVLDEAVFALNVNEFSDVLAGSRGLHIIQSLRVVALAFMNGFDFSEMPVAVHRATVAGRDLQFWAAARQADLPLEMEEVSEVSKLLPEDFNDDNILNSMCACIFDTVPALCWRLSREAFAGKALELGSGMGLPGLRSSAHPIRFQGVLRLLQLNVDLNGLQGRAEVKELRWEDRPVWLTGFDLVIGSDILYEIAGFQLFEAASCALRPGGRLVLANTIRGASVGVAAIQQHAASAGLCLIGCVDAAVGEVAVFEFQKLDPVVPSWEHSSRE